MKKFLLVPILLSFSLLSSAQEVIVNVHGGMAIPSLGSRSSIDVNEGLEGKSGFRFGAGVEFPVNEHFSLVTGLDYSFLPLAHNGFQSFDRHVLTDQFTQQVYKEVAHSSAPIDVGLVPAALDALPDALYADADNRLEFTYFTIPFMAKFGWDIASSPLRVSVAAGLYASYLAVAGQIIEGSSAVYTNADKQTFSEFWDRNSHIAPNETTATAMAGIYEVMNRVARAEMDDTRDVTEYYNSLDVGVAGQVQLSCALDAARKHHLFVQAGYRYGLTTLQSEVANGQNSLRTLTASLGYSVVLGRK